MILGYVEQPSPRAGDQLVLRVSTTAKRWQARFHRLCPGAAPVARTAWLPGEDVPLQLPFHDWGRRNRGLAGELLEPWPAHELEVPGDWQPGVYLAQLVEESEEVPSSQECAAEGRSARALFVVRPRDDADRERILYKLPLFTYHAYNLVGPDTYDPATGQGNWCLYNMPEPDQVPISFPEAVSVHRPGGGTGGAPYDTFNFDPFDPSPRQTFAHWDARMLAWLDAAGYRMDYCTDYDLHRQGRSLLEDYRLLVSAGHDEYWSAEMRDAVEGFRRSGGNVAFFGGNTAWWRISFHGPVSFSRDGWWYETGRPENQLTGVSFRNGGERDRDEKPVPVGYRVQHSGHWVYEGTGVSDGDVFGAEPEQYLVGYECDGADFDRTVFATGRPVVPSGVDGTPRTFVILGVGDTLPSGWGTGNCAATMGVFTDGGTVFTAGTTDWPRVLTGTVPGVLEQITRNVLDRLSS